MLDADACPTSFQPHSGRLALFAFVRSPNHCECSHRGRQVVCGQFCVAIQRDRLHRGCIVGARTPWLPWLAGAPARMRSVRHVPFRCHAFVQAARVCRREEAISSRPSRIGYKPRQAKVFAAPHPMRMFLWGGLFQLGRYCRTSRCVSTSESRSGIYEVYELYESYRLL